MSIELKNPVLITATNKVCPASSTASNPAVIFEGNIGGQYGTRVYSLSISFSSLFTQNYVYLLQIEGVQIGDTDNPNNYQQPDITSPSIDYIKQDTVIKLNPNAKITILGYNATGTTSAGTLSVLIYKDNFNANDVLSNLSFNSATVRI